MIDHTLIIQLKIGGRFKTQKNEPFDGKGKAGKQGYQATRSSEVVDSPLPPKFVK